MDNMTPIIDLWKESGRDMELTISGTSMEPTLRAGDIVIIRLNNDDLKRGDLIAYMNNGGIILHRLVAIRTGSNGREYCQKGDNMKGWCWVHEDSVVGKVVSVNRMGNIVDISNFQRRRFTVLLGLKGALIISAME